MKIIMMIIPLLAREESHRLTTMKYARREEKKGRKSEKKKRCGFIMFVNESAAAGCDIPNDSLARIFFIFNMLAHPGKRKPQ